MFGELGHYGLISKHLGWENEYGRGLKETHVD